MRAACGYNPRVLYAVRGRLERLGPTRLLVEAGGVVFDCHVPLSTYEALPADGEEARVLVHLVIREDEWRMFAFATGEERDAFRALLRVTGVGPTIALALLSSFAPGELGRAVTRGDASALTRVKGVGRKTAERIVVELRDVLAAGDGAGPGAAPPDDAPHVVDAVAALLALGFDAAEARRRVDKALRAGAGKDVGELVRRALRGASAS